jgi:hypothetical protein
MKEIVGFTWHKIDQDVPNSETTYYARVPGGFLFKVVREGRDEADTIALVFVPKPKEEK